MQKTKGPSPFINVSSKHEELYYTFCWLHLQCSCSHHGPGSAKFALLNTNTLLVLMTAMEVLAMINLKQVDKCFAGGG